MHGKGQEAVGYSNRDVSPKTRGSGKAGERGRSGSGKCQECEEKEKKKEQVSTNLLLPGERLLGKKEISSGVMNLKITFQQELPEQNEKNKQKQTQASLLGRRYL